MRATRRERSTGRIVYVYATWRGHYRAMRARDSEDAWWLVAPNGRMTSHHSRSEAVARIVTETREVAV